MNPFLFDFPILPTGFEFPVEYEAMAVETSLPDVEPWNFLSQDMSTSLYYYGSLLLKFPERPLIPFAIISDQSGLYNDGWVVLACFDGSDKTGDPRVYIYDFSNPKTKPWDNLSYPSFVRWLRAAEEESVRYKEERAEAESEG